MIKHVVMWKLKDSAEGLSKDENADLLTKKLLALYGVIPELKSIQVGKDVTHGNGSYDLCLITEFDDVAAMKTYNDCPAHQAVLTYIRKVIEVRIACDFEE